MNDWQRTIGRHSPAAGLFPRCKATLTGLASWADRYAVNAGAFSPDGHTSPSPAPTASPNGEPSEVRRRRRTPCTVRELGLAYATCSYSLINPSTCTVRELGFG